MRARSQTGAATGTDGRRANGPRADDPRVVRSRAAVVDAARTLFLRNGYAGTTMDDIAALAGRTKRTLYNNYADKDSLFTQIVSDAMVYAERFAHGLDDELMAGVTVDNVHGRLDDLGRRLAVAILRPEVVALRRLLISESRLFPALAKQYFDRAPARVIAALASVFDRLGQLGFLEVDDSRRAATQFAYLVVGEPLDRAVLTGTIARNADIISGASEGVETFLARYA